ncbi:hypothetical protein F441_12076 [Phytophthora nicotianae CJ01A1]|uniref:Uncharacterized protein n=2 Tax=Phytophthora nicotianae TaxID=4792 RepID=W2GIV5_PHYNI|nr:hypothetical protein L915_11826 [Phytophthora nicotianae]ETL36249.1 hypothetical protein L916_11751 [Phytophthora nicotianae]ETP12582.1 hypothetical protein F441_12076 [Phytophthora nicotianae CJ01A1]
MKSPNSRLRSISQEDFQAQVCNKRKFAAQVRSASSIQICIQFARLSALFSQTAAHGNVE